jgi:hypothetical protein
MKPFAAAQSRSYKWIGRHRSILDGAAKRFLHHVLISQGLRRKVGSGHQPDPAAIVRMARGPISIVRGQKS